MSGWTSKLKSFTTLQWTFPVNREKHYFRSVFQKSCHYSQTEIKAEVTICSRTLSLCYQLLHSFALRYDWLIQFPTSVVIGPRFSSFRSPLFDGLISFSWSIPIGQTNILLSMESFVNCSTSCKSVNFDLKVVKCVPWCWPIDCLREPLFIISSLRLKY